MNREQDVNRPFVTERSDPANGMSFVDVRVGNGLPTIQVEQDEVVIGTQGIIHKPATKDIDYTIEDPKFNGHGGRFPGFDR